MSTYDELHKRYEQTKTEYEQIKVEYEKKRKRFEYVQRAMVRNRFLTLPAEMILTIFSFIEDPRTRYNFALIDKQTHQFVYNHNYSTKLGWGNVPNKSVMLHRTIKNHNIKGVKTLIKLKADVNANVRVYEECGKYSSLEVAVEGNNRRLIQMLIDAGADIHKQDNQYEQTVIHKAINNNKLVAVQVLIANNANINIRDVNGNTPLHKAVQNQRAKIIELLLKNKADITILNNKGKTPFECL